MSTMVKLWEREAETRPVAIVSIAELKNKNHSGSVCFEDEHRGAVQVRCLGPGQEVGQ